MVPIPRFASWDAFNAHLEAACRKRRQRKLSITLLVTPMLKRYLDDEATKGSPFARVESAHALSGRAIHVWVIDVKTPATAAARFEAILASDELERADKFHFSRLRESFIASRGALRCVLGRYLGRSPAAVKFRYGAKGKPRLVGTDVAFNMSHSGDLVVIAVTTGCPLGIDVEQIRPIREMRSIADQFFCLKEAAEIAELHGDEAERAFYRCWTRKEAYLKATGDGLSEPLNSFCVSVGVESSPGIHFYGRGESGKVWTLDDVSMPSGYTAALAYPDYSRPIVLFETIEAAACMNVVNTPFLQPGFN